MEGQHGDGRPYPTQANAGHDPVCQWYSVWIADHTTGIWVGSALDLDDGDNDLASRGKSLLSLSALRRSRSAPED